jgi:hypothetical protein
MTCLNAVARSHNHAQKSKKSVMPTGWKCYIVRRATAFLRKDSL